MTIPFKLGSADGSSDATKSSTPDQHSPPSRLIGQSSITEDEEESEETTDEEHEQVQTAYWAQ